MRAKYFKMGAFFTLCLIILISTFTGCNPGESNTNTENPVPVLTSVSPGIRALQMPATTITLTGTGFVNGSQVVFNGTAISTQYVSSTQLTAQLSTVGMSLSATAGGSNVSTTKDQTSVPVLVRNPTPGGGDSNSFAFTLTDHPTFTSPVLFTDDSIYSFNPAIALDADGNINVVYESYNSDTSTYAISFTRSPDGGNTWSSPINLVENSDAVYGPDIAIGADGHLNVVFYAYRLYYLRSEDDGISWSVPAILSTDSSYPIESAIVVDSAGGINIVWSQPVETGVWAYPTYFVRSLDNGSTFTTAVMPYADEGYASTTYRLALTTDDSGGVYTSWTVWPLGGSRYSYGYFDYSHDYGATWNENDTTFGIVSSSDIAVDPDGNINFIISSSYLPFLNKIMLYKSTNLGITWETPIDITANGNDYNPSVQIDSIGNINVIFERSESIYYTRSIDGGATWSDFNILGDYVYVMDMAKDEQGNLYIVYENTSTGQIYFLRTQE